MFVLLMPSCPGPSCASITALERGDHACPFGTVASNEAFCLLFVDMMFVWVCSDRIVDAECSRELTIWQFLKA